MRGGRPIAVTLIVALAASSFASSAVADDKALATDLFDGGVKKMQAGQCETSPITDVALCEEARDAFRRAFALYPAGLGALRNLAYVEKALGRVASAARSFRELARRAPLDPKPARRIWAEFAQKELASIEPTVPHVTLRVPASPPPSLRVTLDGEDVPAAAWGAPLEVDPGAHRVSAEAEGTMLFEQSFDVGLGESTALDVVLAPATEASTSSPEKNDTPAKTPTLSPTPEPRAPSRLAPLIVTGVGAVTLVVGLGLGVAAIEKRRAVCDDRFCDPAGYDSGRSLARASTLVTTIGAVTLASGLVWYLLAPRAAQPNDRPIAFSPYGTTDGGAGIAAWGRF